MNMLKILRKNLILSYFYMVNRLTKKYKKNIMFRPHANSSIDNYDLLNGDSDNVLCLINNLLRDRNYNDYHFYIGYYDKSKLYKYIEYCQDYKPERLHFYLASDIVSRNKALCKCSLVFTDETFQRYRIKTKAQKIVCLNYYAGFMKNDYYRIKNHGGFKRMLREQKDMHDNYDKIISTSDLSAMFLNVEDCMYYGDILPLGFPRNDIFYRDNTSLRKSLEEAIEVPFKHIITYVPTHRDYENEVKKDFFDKSLAVKRSIFGAVTDCQLQRLDNVLAQNEAVIIAKVHPRQARSVLKENGHNKRVIFYHDLVNKVCTSLNPLLAVSDFLITDYTTAVYDFMHTNRPIIYYFYDIKEYAGSRGLFIDPIEPICAGEITYTFDELCNSIEVLSSGKDCFKTKREVISDLLIKNKDGVSTERIKRYFLKKI